MPYNLSNHKRKDVARRVARIQGHVHAVKEMLDEGRSYSDVVHQLAAIRASIDSAIQVIVDDLVEDCVAKTERKEPISDNLLELREIVARIR
jgi:CsoR family transcriptional regulator, copper-sensing transcriptional repressor